MKWKMMGRIHGFWHWHCCLLMNGGRRCWKQGTVTWTRTPNDRRSRAHHRTGDAEWSVPRKGLLCLRREACHAILHTTAAEMQSENAESVTEYQI